jgi:TetR/AcrR family transcriptional repressor of mexCD-oprJ operon
MSELTRPRRRADAERSIAAILDAAVAVLSRRPDASIGEIAAAAGLSRQTVYAHYESREALLAGVAERALAQTLAAIDAAEPARGAPEEALVRLVRAWWGSVERYARVLEALASVFPHGEEVRAFHDPILERLEDLVRRGQRTGAFDRRMSAQWLTTVFLALMHAAADEVAAGRIGAADAGRALERTVPRAFGV